MSSVETRPDISTGPKHHSLDFDSGRVTAHSHRTVLPKGGNFTGNIGSDSGQEARKTKQMRGDLPSILTKLGKPDLLKAMHRLKSAEMLELAKSLENIYPNPEVASKDNYKETINFLETYLKSKSLVK